MYSPLFYCFLLPLKFYFYKLSYSLCYPASVQSVHVNVSVHVNPTVHVNISVHVNVSVHVDASICLP